MDKITLKDIIDAFSTGDKTLDAQWILVSLLFMGVMRLTVFNPDLGIMSSQK